MVRLLRSALCTAVLIALATVPAAAQESWDAIYLGGSKVGFMHVRVEPVKDGRGRDLVRVRVDWDMKFKRGKDRVELKQVYGTIETPQGAVLKIDTRTQTSDADIRTSGEMDPAGGIMNMTLAAGGNKQVVPLPWTSDIRGPYAAELSLSREPLAIGGSRVVKTYIPDLNKVCLTKLRAERMESIELGPDRTKRELLRVEQVVADESDKPLPGMASTLWVDATGQILKSHTDLLGGMDTFRTTKLGANSDFGLADFDLLAESIIKVPNPIANSDQTRSVVYRVTMDKELPGEVFPADRRQTIKPGDDKHIATVEVITAGPEQGEIEVAVVGPESLAPNALVNSEDRIVVQHTKKAVQGIADNDPWAKAVAIESWVFKNIKKKNFGTAFAPSAEVARNLEGDCTEHSLLVAAMCRAAGVPSRSVVGIVYAPNMNGFGPHMWNEVFVNRRWVAIDAAFGQSEVDATHLKLATTTLDGVAPFEAFLPVLKVFKGIKVEPIEIRATAR